MYTSYIFYNINVGNVATLFGSREKKMNRNMNFFHKFLNLLYKALRENIQFRNQQTISPGTDVLKIDKPSTINSVIAIT